MIFETVILAGALCIVVAAQNSPAAPTRSPKVGSLAQPQQDAKATMEPEVALRARAAQFGVDLDQPESLYDLVGAIERSFGTKISIEPLPEHCAGADGPEAPPEPFAIVRDEGFNDVVARLEAASQGRWIFDEIHGVPLLHPNPLVEGHGTLLDTIISVDIEVSSMWEALCALARAVNRANEVSAHEARPLIIRFLGPTLMRHPAPMFIEKKSIRLALKEVTAREGLCAIFAQVGENIQYSYTCVAKGRQPEYDYIDISAFDGEGTAINGGRMSGVDYERLLKTEDWMSDEGILAVQAPALDNADSPAKP